MSGCCHEADPAWCWLCGDEHTEERHAAFVRQGVADWKAGRTPSPGDGHIYIARRGGDGSCLSCGEQPHEALRGRSRSAMSGDCHDDGNGPCIAVSPQFCPPGESCPDDGRCRFALPLHRTEAGYPSCSTCDGGGCPDCTDPA